jgi:hypothetical protein
MIMFTAEQQIEIKMYGMTTEQLRSEIENSMYVSILKDADLLVMSMLSDAQEMVNYSVSAETIEEQRKLINRAKFVLRYYVMDRAVA